MNAISKLKTALVCGIFLAPFMIVCMMMTVAARYPDGKSDSRLAQLLLKRLTIQTALPENLWENGYRAGVESLKAYVESYCTSSFPGGQTIDGAVSALKKNIYHYDLERIAGEYESMEFVDPAASAVARFAKEMEGRDIFFMYVQTPSEQSVQYFSGQEMRGTGESLLVPKRAEALARRLTEEDVCVQLAANEYGDGVTFDATGHWKPEDGLQCAMHIAEELNGKAQFEFDPHTWDADQMTDFMDTQPELREEIYRLQEYEFRLPTPAVPDEYTVTYHRQTEWSGDFAHTLLGDPARWTPEARAYHNLFRLTNSSLYEIRHADTATNKGKKIVVIGDSSNYPVSSYLAMGVEYLSVIYPFDYEGSILSYVDGFQPDAVVIVYNDAELYSNLINIAYLLD